MSRREDTCHGKKCPFYVRYQEYCPHFIESPWETTEGERYTTNDCAPKRSILLQQQMYNLILGTRKDTNKTRNVTQKFIEAIVCSSGAVVEAEVIDQTLIEDKTNNGKDTG
jgi:hypothetical protein